MWTSQDKSVFSSTLWILEIELRSLGFVASALTHPAISHALSLFLSFLKVIFYYYKIVESCSILWTDFSLLINLFLIVFIFGGIMLYNKCS